jgi:hypothetical protein
MNTETTPKAFKARLLGWADSGREAWPEDRRERARKLDQYLVSERGLGLYIGTISGAWGSFSLMRRAGVPLGWALLFCGLFFGSLLWLGRQAWLDPERFSGRRLAGLAGLMLVATYTATLGLAWRQLQAELGHPPEIADAPRVLWAATPLQLVLGMMLLLGVWGISSSRRWQLQRDLERLRLVQERDAAARQAAEARLRLLQVQIQPHFIFNTLAALQHWVDTSDPRAPGLLRALTGFLRSSTELMAREQVQVAEELAMLQQYLTIQQARLGPRLQASVEVPAALGAASLPPGVLLTLVENALEHGIAPSLQGGRLHVHGSAEPAGLWLWVDNTGQPLQAEPIDGGVGLRNCRERLQRQAGEGARLELRALADGQTRAQVWLPEPRA